MQDLGAVKNARRYHTFSTPQRSRYSVVMSNPRPHTPTASDLLADPIVTHSLQGAWTDSLVHDPQLRHEEVDWICLNVETGEITTQHALSGE